FVGKKGTIWDGYDGSNMPQLTCTADNVQVRGIEFQNGTRAIAITGHDAKVVNCRFRGCDDAIWITGNRANVSNNGIYGEQGSDYSIEIYGYDAIVRKNKLSHCYYAGIYVDAMSGGTCTVTENITDSTQDNTTIMVTNASAPKIKKNRLSYGYMNGACIEVSNSDDAEICGNKIVAVNYYVIYGIYVTGNNAKVYKNTIDTVNAYDDACYGVYISGNDANVSKNKIRNCSPGDDDNTYGVYVSGDDAVCEKNKISDLAGGEGDAYGIYTSGDDASVSKNRFSRLTGEYTYPIECSGDRAVVSKNGISYYGDGYGIYVSGDDFMVTDNTVKCGAYSAQAIYTSGNATMTATARIENNKVHNIGYDGIYHSGNGCWIRYNDCKYVTGDSYYVSGDNNVVRENKSRYCQDDAFYISGSGNVVTKCVARDAARDGFDNNGAGNTYDRCKAYDCVAEGFDNSAGATSTIVTNSTFRGSRYDYCGNGNVSN
ncbi:MAG: hypothetical protein HND52_20915, partial [Ignavibacteriae bacterium]|nr:hypothetical protein [Ignavibacteriota bacterium]